MRYRLSTLLAIVPLLGLATFGGLKWYELRAQQREQREMDELIDLITRTIQPQTSEAAGAPGEIQPTEVSSASAFPESDFGPIPVDRPKSLR